VLFDATFAQGADTVGYIVFNDHIATAEAQLVAAINRLQGVDDLILDIRYNGGGFLDIASELAYMISGRTGTFESLVFNSKHPGRNPVLDRPLTPTPVHTTTQDFSVPPGQPLPTLSLDRVYVLTGPGTCSASESIINGLRGLGVEVFQIGSTTCGKPFGFYAQDNCGTTYFSIQFQGLNAMSFGDYPDGFAPNNQGGASSVKLGGCSIGDDFTRALGDTNEGRLKAALDFRASGNSNASCPGATGFAPGTQLKAGQTLSATDGQMIKSPVRENRIIRD
jgi:carboxyl-terminal processing protease